MKPLGPTGFRFYMETINNLVLRVRVCIYLQETHGFWLICGRSLASHARLFATTDRFNNLTGDYDSTGGHSTSSMVSLCRRKGEKYLGDTKRHYDVLGPFGMNFEPSFFMSHAYLPLVSCHTPFGKIVPTPLLDFSERGVGTRLICHCLQVQVWLSATFAIAPFTRGL